MPGDAAGKVSALAAVFALVLLVSLFLPWAQEVCEREPCPYPTGWEVQRFLDVVLFCLAVVSIAVGFLSVARPATGPAVGLIVLGAVALFLVFLAPLVEDRGSRPVDFGGSWFLGVFGALGVVACGVATYFIRADTGGDEGDDEEDEGERDNGEGDKGEGGDGQAGEESDGQEGDGQAGADHEGEEAEDGAGEDADGGGTQGGEGDDSRT